jgi:hypothetical protein
MVFISKTKRLSSELVDLAAAHSDNITRTPSNTLSDNIDTTRVLAVPASIGTTTFSFRSRSYKIYLTMTIVFGALAIDQLTT